MKITKIKIRNLFGITEYESNGQSQELSGTNGAGKTSVIDAIRLALTNKSDRSLIVRRGETEGEILVETDNGLRIDRKIRTDQADYKSVKKDGREVGSPESFLRDIFTPLQLNPVEFMGWDTKKQNAAILDMIDYPWSMQTIQEWFGEIPSWVSYDQNILSVLNDIQAENGEYFQTRQDVNRDIRNKKAFTEDIAAALPSGYDSARWENENIGELYQEIERIRKSNEQIEKAKLMLANHDNRIRKFEADREIRKAAIDREFSSRKTMIREQIASLEEQINSYRKELTEMGIKKKDKIQIAEQTYKADVAQFEAEVAEYKEYAGKEPAPTEELQEQAETAERMKGHLNEYRRMISLQDEVTELQGESQALTYKIEKARMLPGEILETAVIPIAGLTVKDGVPLINGLPISNLSDGEKLDLCIDVAIQKPNGLQIILIDGVEKLSSRLRESLYKKCQDKGLQFIATRTTDDDDLTVVTL